MRLPDPIANTTTEAYLAYKAGVLNVGDLKPSLYDPYLHYDAWLAYWAGLVDTYPIHDVGKNLFNPTNRSYFINSAATQAGKTSGADSGAAVVLKPNTNYTITSRTTQARFRIILMNTLPTAPQGMWGYSGINRDGTAFPQGLTVNSSDHGYLIVNATNLADVQVEEGSTATPYEPYTGTAECLTDEEALVAYLSGVTNTYPEEYSDPIDARITGYLRYLVSARFGRPDYPVNNIEFYLSLMKPPIVTNDSPSSNIELDNTAWAELIDVKMYGDTSQQTYTGKNLAHFVPKDVLSQGIISTYDAKTGIISVSGTATETWADIGETVDQNIPTGQYIFSPRLVSGTYPALVKMRLLDGSTTVMDFSTTMGETHTRTTSTDSNRNRIWITGLTVGTTYNFSFELQLEAGNQATSFEPYVGGVPAPNPDYPQPVQTVTGRQVVKVQGKNLFDINSETTGDYRVTTSMTDGTLSVTASVNGTGYHSIAVPDSRDILGKTCKLSLSGAATQASCQIRVYESKYGNPSSVSGDAISQLVFTGEGEVDITFPESFSANRDCFVVLFYPSSAMPSTLAGATATYSNIQLEIGDQSTTYEPYQSQEYEVNLGKNLYDKGNYKTALGYYNALTGTFTYSPYVYTTYIPCQPNTTYTVQKMVATQNPRFNVFITAEPPANGVAVLASVGTPGAYDASETLTITTPAKGKYLCILYARDTTVPAEKTIRDSIQIEVGSIATTYAPYFDPIELCKIGDYQDRIYRNEGAWYIHKEVRKKIFNGSEDWVSYTSTGFTAFYYTDSDAVSGSASSNPVMSDSFISKYANEDGVIYLRPNPRQVVICASVANSVANWKTWLEQHNVTAYYAITEPTDTEITNAALVAQLDALAAAKSYNDKTYITVEATDPNLPALLKVEAGEYR